jgi:ATP-dependent protease ClpP protease subunit
MTIHPVRISGTVLGVPQTFRYFTDMQQRIVRFIVDHSHISEEKLTELLLRPDELATDVGSIVEGDEAVRIGLIDEVGGLDAALEALRGMIRAGKGDSSRNR